MKNNGIKLAPLKISEIKQIAGRAGRYRTADQAVKADAVVSNTTPTPSTDGEPSPAEVSDVVEIDDVTPAFPEHSVEYTTEQPGITGRQDENILQTQSVNASRGSKDVSVDIKTSPSRPKNTDEKIVGFVTTLEQADFPSVRRAMTRNADPIQTAGIFPSNAIIERFASYFPPGAPFSYILLRLHEISRTHGRYHLCNLKDQLKIADTIHPVKNLTTADRLTFCASPSSCKDMWEKKLVLAFARCVGEQKACNIVDTREFDLEILDEEPSADRKYLSRLEILHKSLVLYLWLSFRFSGVFTTRALASYTKSLVEERIESSLAMFSFTEQATKNIRQKREKELLKEMQRQLEEDRMEKAEYKGASNERDDTELASGDRVPEFERGLGEIKDVIEDKGSFEEDDASVGDDMGEYPAPEIDMPGVFTSEVDQRGSNGRAPLS